MCGVGRAGRSSAPSRRAGRSEAAAGPPSWCAHAGGKLGRAGCGPVRQHGAAAGWAALGRAGRERGREKKAGLAGLGQKVTFFFFQIKCLSNSIFSILIFKPNSNKF